MGNYESVLKAMGYDVVNYAEFGSYQGYWAAIVRVDDKIGIIDGSYGSCSGCDAYEAHFHWDEKKTKKKLKEFGENEGYKPNFNLNEALILSGWSDDTDEKVRWLETELKNLGLDVAVTEEDDEND